MNEEENNYDLEGEKRIERNYHKFIEKIKKENIDVDILKECMDTTMQSNYIDGWNDGVDNYELSNRMLILFSK